MIPIEVINEFNDLEYQIKAHFNFKGLVVHPIKRDFRQWPALLITNTEVSEWEEVCTLQLAVSHDEYIRGTFEVPKVAAKCTRKGMRNKTMPLTNFRGILDYIEGANEALIERSEKRNVRKEVVTRLQLFLDTFMPFEKQIAIRTAQGAESSITGLSAWHNFERDMTTTHFIDLKEPQTVRVRLEYAYEDVDAMIERKLHPDREIRFKVKGHES